MDMNQMMPASGRILAEDGSVKNVVDILGAGVLPVSSEVYDIEQYSPRSGRVIGEDGLLYNLVDLLENSGGGGGGGTTNHAALSNLAFAGSGHTGFASQAALDTEAQTRHQEIVEAIGTEAIARQQEDTRLNGEIVETNRVLSGKVTQTLTGLILNKQINGETAVAKTSLSSAIPLIGGASWVNDADGTLAIYTEDLNPNTAKFRTKTISAQQAEELRIEATGDEEISILAGSAIYLPSGGFYYFSGNLSLGVADLDVGSSFVLGGDYYIYICKGASSVLVLLSLNPTAPAGFDATDSRKIGGFHFGVCRRDTTLPENVYDGIVPRSIWTLMHRPKCAPEGMVYLSGGVWVDIYLSSDDGAGGVKSAYDVLPISGVEALNWYVANTRLTNVGKRMLTYEEFIQAAMGSPPGTGSGNQNAWTSASERAATGFVRNAVSTIGCRDCVGNLWEWLSNIIASGVGEAPGWFNPMSGLDQGQMWINADGDFRAILAGGSFFNGALVGARSACTIFSPWTSNSSFGVRGACGSA